MISRGEEEEEEDSSIYRQIREKWRTI